MKKIIFVFASLSMAAPIYSKSESKELKKENPSERQLIKDILEKAKMNVRGHEIIVKEARKNVSGHKKMVHEARKALRYYDLGFKNRAKQSIDELIKQSQRNEKNYNIIKQQAIRNSLVHNQLARQAREFIK